MVASEVLPAEAIEAEAAEALADLEARYGPCTPVRSEPASVLFVGTDPNSGSRVAIQVFDPPAPSWDPAAAVETAEAFADLSHPHLAEVHEVGKAGRAVWVVSELGVEGSLADLATARPDSTAGRLGQGFVLMAGEALEAVHGAGLLHLGWSPTVLAAAAGERPLLGVPELALLHVDPADRLKLAVRSGRDVYLPPEVLAGEVPGTGADWYGLAAVAFEPLAGRPHFLPWEVWRAVDQGRWPLAPPADREDASKSFVDVLRAILAPDPAARARGMEALRAGNLAPPGEDALPEGLEEVLRTARAENLVGLAGHPRAGLSWGFWVSVLMVAAFGILALLAFTR